MPQTTTLAPTATPELQAFKERQKQVWSTFEGAAPLTLPASARLVRFAQVQPGEKVLDVGTGTGNLALTAAREGATVTGIDLTPNLLEVARRTSALLGLKVDWREGDAEALPFADGAFDVVLSQFGHMFAPRPEVATAEMLRVLRPGGRIVFATWPAESLPGRLFALHGKMLPPPPGVPSVVHWGDTATIRTRLGGGVGNVRFERGTFSANALGPRHFMAFQEANLGPLKALIESLAKSGPAALDGFRSEYLQVVEPYFDGNEVRHDYLMTRATKS
jgi:SAM-dependent methyltransferase